MTFELQQAVALLRDLLWLKTADLSPADRQDVNSVTDEILQAAFDDVKRLMVDWAQEVAAHAQRLIEAQEQAARDVIEEEERAAKALVQDAADEEERRERLTAGVS